MKVEGAQKITPTQPRHKNNRMWPAFLKSLSSIFEVNRIACSPNQCGDLQHFEFLRGSSLVIIYGTLLNNLQETRPGCNAKFVLFIPADWKIECHVGLSGMEPF